MSRSFAWIGRKPLTVTVNGHPNLHIICRVAPDNSRIAIAIQNTHLDPVNGVTLRLSPDIYIGDEIEILLPSAAQKKKYGGFTYRNDGTYGYLSIPLSIPPMELLGIGLLKQS